MKHTFLLSLLVGGLFAAPAPARSEDAPSGGQAPAVLSATIATLDSAVFDAFNRCSEPGQLDRHAGYFTPDVEFYHDTGGVTWTRDAMIANTGKYVCGHFRRELVPGTLRVYPVKDFGAIAQGVHRFCQLDSGACEGLADFLIVWKQEPDGWRISRVMSYGHRAAPVDAPEAATSPPADTPAGEDVAPPPRG